LIGGRVSKKETSPEEELEKLKPWPLNTVAEVKPAFFPAVMR
jgi:hypothetical protein